MSNVERMVAESSKQKIMTTATIRPKNEGVNQDRGFVMKGASQENSMSFAVNSMERIRTTATISNPKKDTRNTNAQVIQKPATVLYSPTIDLAPKCDGCGINVPFPVDIMEVFNAAKPEKSPDVQKYPDVLNLDKAISKIANYIGEYLHIQDVFNNIKWDLKDRKIDAKTFYRKVQNCIYHTLIDFCGIETDEEGTNIILPFVPGSPCIPTLTFFDRIFNEKNICFEKNPSTLMNKYRKLYPDCDGIQPEWIECFKTRMKEKRDKLLVDDRAINEIANIIRETWCSTIIPVSTEEISAEEVNLSRFPVEISMEKSRKGATVVQTPVPNDDEEDDPEDEPYDEDEDLNYPIIEILLGEKFDIIHVISSDTLGQVVYPFYEKLDTISIDKHISSIADDRNGIWDGLIHLLPDLPFNTADPERYIAGNEDIHGTDVKCVIMDDIDKTYTIGVYANPEIFITDEEGIRSQVTDEEEYIDIMKKITYLINDNISTGPMSHLAKTLTMPEIFREEKYILQHVMEYEGLNNEGDDNLPEGIVDPEDDNSHLHYDINHNEDPIEVLGDANKAAIEAVLGRGQDANISYDNDEENYPTDPNEDEPEEIDPSIITFGGKEYNTEEGFTFTPRRKKQHLER